MSRTLQFAAIMIESFCTQMSCYKSFVNMVLITPKRLFNVDTMETVMYKDVVDDVKENGYVAISHVWGNQKKYVPKGVGVTGGVTWTIPLSDPDKMFRVKDAMSRYKEKYCWFDVLCMPQDKQNEINEEIPFMGDYYAGADIVLVLATMDVVISKIFGRWYDMMDDVMKKNRYFTNEELDWIESYNTDLLDISEETWFKRLWTWQEAVMAKELILVCGNGVHIQLFDVSRKISLMYELGADTRHLFGESGYIITNVLSSINSRTHGYLNLAGVMVRSSKRDSFKPQDKFYGVFGVLGYKDFPVNYEIKMDDLNIAIVKYAHSKGDVSWLSVGGDLGAGFIQPMYKPFQKVGWGWKEDAPGVCEIRLEGEIMYINAWPFAKVICCGEPMYVDVDAGGHIGEMYKTFKHWGLGIGRIVKCMTSYTTTPNDVEAIQAVLESYVGNRELLVSFRTKPNTNKRRLSAIDRLAIEQDSEEMTVIKATTWENKDVALRVVGNVGIGDQIMLVRTTDRAGRCLGIVVDKYFRRKGVCLYEKMEMSEEMLSRYTPQEFPL